MYALYVDFECVRNVCLFDCVFGMKLRVLLGPNPGTLWSAVVTGCRCCVYMYTFFVVECWQWCGMAKGGAPYHFKNVYIGFSYSTR